MSVCVAYHNMTKLLSFLLSTAFHLRFYCARKLVSSSHVDFYFCRSAATELAALRFEIELLTC